MVLRKNSLASLMALMAIFIRETNPALAASAPGLEKEKLLGEHVFGGLPGTGDVHLRPGYIMSYDAERRVPRWVAYHITPDYLKTPVRKGKFKSFKPDLEVSNPVKDKDYIKLEEKRGFERGHLAPYAVMGGDRDGDGKYAAQDPDDAETVYQANLMSNIAPQHGSAFNGGGGVWYKLERWEQEVLLKKAGEVWVLAGCIFGPAAMEKVGPKADIEVPPMFFKILVAKGEVGKPPQVLAFLFPHHRTAHGEIQNFLTTVDVIEAMTGLDFFKDLPDEQEKKLEDQDAWETGLLLGISK